jgi:hypothetical protein
MTLGLSPYRVTQNNLRKKKEKNKKTKFVRPKNYIKLGRFFNAEGEGLTDIDKRKSIQTDGRRKEIKISDKIR